MSEISPAWTAPSNHQAKWVESSLRFRYRAFLVTWSLLVACVGIALFAAESAWASWAVAASGWIMGIGLPWLTWHLRVPFSGRVFALTLLLAGHNLHGIDPRGEIWTLGDLPMIFFLAGWSVDICLRQKRPNRIAIGRLLFSILWIFLIRRALVNESNQPAMWFGITGMILGIVSVWLPRGKLLPSRLRSDPGSEEAVRHGLKFAGGWLATRVGIGILILFPSLVYLDLLDLPPLLQESMVKSESSTLGGSAIFFWTREARALRDEDFQQIEVYEAEPNTTNKIIAAIRELRRDPTSSGRRSELAALSTTRVTDLVHLLSVFGTRPIFYIDPIASGDDRVTGGLWVVPEKRWSSWSELRMLGPAQVEKISRNVGRSTVVILAGGVLILLLLGGPSGGSAAAWWLSILLAGTHFGWVRESLDLVSPRVGFVIWKDYANVPLGGTLFIFHSVLLGFMRLAEWITSSLFAHAGLWVALCWTARPSPLLRSWTDSLCLQFAKTLLVFSLFYLTRFFFFLVGSLYSAEWLFYTWFVLSPILLVGGGAWWRRRQGDGRKLPRVGQIAATAFAVRLFVTLLTNLEGNGQVGSWVGSIAVLLAVIAAILFVIALERGTFLNPPHVEGQLWIIAVAAIPFIENVVGDPVFSFIEGSELFLGSTVGWLAFAASLWVIGPITSFIGEFLSRRRARGLEEISSFQDHVLGSEKGADVVDSIGALCQQLKIEDPQLWRHDGTGRMYQIYPLVSDEGLPLLSGPLAQALGGATGSLRLEEMQLEWQWAAYHGELACWFRQGGDLILVPATYENHLLGIFSCPDLDQNRFLLRPAVATALASALAAAFLRSPSSPQVQAIDRGLA
ncbi:MAG: hypothetical protein KA250_14025 [Verrucomicrobiales bacterium]|jgi:hypothetical protein|nr:hypothetical protein [Verrucomicrobiales bacterium]